MKYLFLFCSLFLYSCSGSLTNSGIFFSESKAKEEQQLKINDLKESQDQLKANEEALNLTEKQYAQLSLQIKNLEKSINRTKSEIAKLEDSKGANQAQLSDLQKSLKHDEERLANLKNLEKEMSSPVKTSKKEGQTIQKLDI